MNQNKSSAGDWLFLIGSIGLVGGYLIYENAAHVAGWLQSISNAPIIPSSGLLAFLIGNWGLVLLITAIIFAVFKLSSDSNTTNAEGSNMIRYKNLKYVSVKLIR